LDYLIITGLEIEKRKYTAIEPSCFLISIAQLLCFFAEGKLNSLAPHFQKHKHTSHHIKSALFDNRKWRFDRD